MQMKTPINVVRDHTGLTDRAIRYYCELDLVACERDGRGTRIFDSAAVDRLLIIRDLRRAGSPIDQIAKILSTERDRAKAVRAELARLSRDAERQAAEIRALLATWEEDEAASNLSGPHGLGRRAAVG